MKEDENMSLKIKCLIGVWILMTSKIYRWEDLLYGFEDCLYWLCKQKGNYKNLFKLMTQPTLKTLHYITLNLCLKALCHFENST